MKRYFFGLFVAAVFIFSGCEKIKTLLNFNNEENKILIKTMGIEMVAPSKNKKAMNEFIDGTQLLNDGDYEKIEGQISQYRRTDTRRFREERFIRIKGH